MPYVTVLAAGGYTTHRTDKTRYYQVPVTFHIWADAEVANALENALTLARAIGDAYVDTCWTLTATDKVIDCLDEGEPLVNQVKLPTHHIWEVVQMVTVCLERSRVDENTCCQ